MVQFFKGDAEEQKFYESGQPMSDALLTQKNAMFEDAFNCFILGELLYDNNLSPLSNAIPRNIFRENFSVIFDAFTVSGSLESYLTVFRNVFGEDVDVEFTVPGPGKLGIDITADGFQLSNFIARRVVSGSYIFDNVVDEDDNKILFQTVKGFESQYDLEQMLFEMVPDGIYTEITLTVGG